MEKRISTRGVIIEDNYVYLMFRRKIKENGEVNEYYVIPGGGIEEGETHEENVKREIKEEFSLDVKVGQFLGKDEGTETIAYFYKCDIISGIPKLGGPELEKQCESNYYEIRKVNINELDGKDVIAKDIILKAYNQN